MKIKLLISGVLMVSILSSFFIFKKEPKEKFACTCGILPARPALLSRTGPYVTVSWPNVSSGTLHHYKYLYYLNAGGTVMGTTGSTQITFWDGGQGGSIVVTPVCKDPSLPTTLCEGTPLAGSWN